MSGGELFRIQSGRPQEMFDPPAGSTAEATGEMVLGEDAVEKNAKKAAEWFSTLQGFAMMCMEAERMALQDGDIRELAHAGFTLPVRGIDPRQSGPRVWIRPGLFGTVGIISLDPASPTMVRVACSDLRAWMRGLKGPHPELGVDPGALARGFLEALGHKDLDDKRAERLKRHLKGLADMQALMEKGLNP